MSRDVNMVKVECINQYRLRIVFVCDLQERVG